MKHIFTTLILLALISSGQAQDFGKNLGSVSLAISGQPPADFMYNKDKLQITVTDQSMSYMTFTIRNDSETEVNFLWAESYYVITEETIPFENADNGGARAFGLEVKESNSLQSPVVIGSKSKVTVKAASKRGMLFNYRTVNKYYNDNSKLPNDRIVLTFLQGERNIRKVEIPIQVYTGKIKKALKK